MKVPAVLHSWRFLGERGEYSCYFASLEVEIKEVDSVLFLNRAPEMIHEFARLPAL
jgi:hypothetical protein